MTTPEQLVGRLEAFAAENELAANPNLAAACELLQEAANALRAPAGGAGAIAAEREQVDRLLAGFEGAFRDSGDHVQETTMRAIRAAHRQRYAKLDLPITPQPITPRTHHG